MIKDQRILNIEDDKVVSLLTITESILIEDKIENSIKKTSTSISFSQENSKLLDVSKSLPALGSSYSLRDALNSFKSEETTESKPIEALDDSLTEFGIEKQENVSYELTFPTEIIADFNNKTTPIKIENISSSPTQTISPQSDTDKLQILLSNNQLTKEKLDEITNESKRINNNLKLYLIVNILSNDDASNVPENDSNREDDKSKSLNIKQEDDEIPISIFRMKYFFYKKKKSNQNNAGGNEAKKSTETLNCISNCLCVLTNKNIILFKLFNQELFNNNMDFDKCLKKRLSIEINQIETIEVGLGQNYLIVDKQENNKNINFKFVTMDVYQSQAFLSILLSLNLRYFFKAFLFGI